MESQIITIKQLPIIEERLQLIKAEIDAKTQHVLALDCNDATVKAIKKPQSRSETKISASLKKKSAKRSSVQLCRRMSDLRKCIPNA